MKRFLRVRRTSKSRPIPHDIWAYIASFIPASLLGKLYSVNRSFLEIGMNVRYRKTRFGNFDSTMLKKFDRLKDPFVAKRVRTLHVTLSPWFSKVFMIDNNGRIVILPTTPKDVVQTMVDVVVQFSNVTEFVIEWAKEPSPQTLLPFLTAAWKTFGHNLQGLLVEVPLHKFDTLALSSVNLDAVRKLVITIPCTEDGGVIESRSILTSTVAPLVNRLSPRLRKFSLWSKNRNLDLSPLFLSLPPFPKLHHLEITLPSDSAETSAPGVITRILRDHADTLEHVGVSLGSDLDDSWLRSNLTDPSCLSNLRTLTLDMHHSDAKLAIDYARRSSNTLTTLALMGAFMTYDEVYSVVNLFSRRPPNQRLDSLYLWVVILTPRLLDVIAGALPYLRALHLVILDIAYDPYEGGPPQQTSTTLRRFESQMQWRTYKHWKLSDISVSVITGPTSEVPDCDIMVMKIIIRSVPSIEYCRGHMLVK